MLKKICVVSLSVVLMIALVQVAYASKEPDHPKAPPTWKRLAPRYETAVAGTLLHATFETGAEGFLAVDGTDVGVFWHQSAANAYDEMSWWCADEDIGGYDNWWYQVLDTDPIQLGSSSEMTCKVLIDCECTGCEEYQCDWDGGLIMISTDGGSTFEPIEPDVGGYNTECDSLWAFQFHGVIVLGGYPAWICTSDVFTDVHCDLSDYDGYEVIIRFAFLSDAATSTDDGNPEYLGMLVDEISVSDNTGEIFFNDAGDTRGKRAAQGDMHPGYITRGINWVLTTDDYHSPTHSWHIDFDDHYELQTEWVESPYVALPAGEYPEVSYWIRCDAPDSDGDDDNTLEDDYQMELLPQDSTDWIKMFHDYERSGVDTVWMLWDKDQIYNGFMRLDDYAGQTVKFRWRTVSDDNDDGGNGDGMYFDDVIVFSRGAPDNDVGIEFVVVPFPMSVNFPIPVTGYIRNYGLNNQPGVIAWYFVEDRDENKVVGNTPTGPPWPAISSGQELPWEFDFTPPDTGIYRVGFFQFVPDQYPANDSNYSAYFRAYPEKEGYMAHNYFLSEYGHSGAGGEGPAMRYDPPAGIGQYNIVTVEIDLSRTGGFKCFIYEASGVEDTIPDDGTLLHETDVFDVPAHSGSEYYGFDVSEVPACQERIGSFWVYYEFQDANDLGYSGATSPFPPTNSFYYEKDDGLWHHDDEDYRMRCYLEWGQGSACEGTRGDVTGDGNINVLDILAIANHILGINVLSGDALCRADCSGDGVVNILDALAVANVILGILTECPGLGACKPEVTPEVIELMESLGLYLSAENHAEIMTLIKGYVGVPAEYGLAQNYPNPFNPTTRIQYTVASNVHTELKVYNMLGQEVVTLINEMKAPGVYTAEWDAADMASGVYFYRLTAGDYSAVRRMVLMK